jgi:hypothetical protein
MPKRSSGRVELRCGLLSDRGGVLGKTGMTVFSTFSPFRVRRRAAGSAQNIFLKSVFRAKIPSFPPDKRTILFFSLKTKHYCSFSSSTPAVLRRSG